MAVYCSFVRSSTSCPTICVLYFSVDVFTLLILPLRDGFHCLHTVILVDSYPNGLHAAMLVEYRIGWLKACDHQRLSSLIMHVTAR